MGAPRMTPQEIVQMHRLYAQLGNYAAVGKAMGRSASTVIKQEIQPSSADELKKYKELLDSGVITQEEFDAKKKQLLGL